MSDDSDIECFNCDEDIYLDGEENNAGSSHKEFEDPEYFFHKSWKVEEVEEFLNESVERLSNNLLITPSLAKVILPAYKWNEEEIEKQYKENADKVLVHSHMKPEMPSTATTSKICCEVCANTPIMDKYSALTCAHYFCIGCWTEYFEERIESGVSSTIQCMAHGCGVIAREDFFLTHVSKSDIRDRYQQLMFKEHVNSHPRLLFCPGPDCQWIFYASPREGPSRVECRGCGLLTCFSCGAAHHAPADCATMRRWHKQCAEDSATANYMLANTKPCPKCLDSIENGGDINDNIIQCISCYHFFCWVCLANCENRSRCWNCDFKNLGCSARTSFQSQAQKALEKHFYHYTRWKKHEKYLILENQKLAENERHDQLMVNTTPKEHEKWIDFQSVSDAIRSLIRCRYTLQYTYPAAYYLNGPKKHLFEYQQEYLEKEVINLSEKIQNADVTERGRLKYQMNKAEKSRILLLKDLSELNTRD